MEYTPKKQPLSAVSTSAVRHNPYASGGASFIRKFKHRNSLQTPRTTLITPPRTNVNRRYVSRTDRILASSKKLSVPERNVGVKTPNKQKTLPQATKRPFRAINGQDSKDPYNVTGSEDETTSSPRKETKSLVDNDKENLCCSSEDEIFLKSYNKEHKKPVTSFEKENALFSPPKSKTVRVYSNKKKPIPVFIGRSRLVNDISPEKVEKAYGTKSILIDSEKENVPMKNVADSSSSSQVLVPHLIGFPNYGNTCYLNSVLQSLLGLPTFLFDYRQIASELGLNHTSLFYGLFQVLYNRMKGQASAVKLSLRTVKENLERIDGSFTGFKMQDANEFLTKVLDTIKDEIDRFHASEHDGCSTTESQSLNCNANEDLDEDIFLCGASRKNTKELFTSFNAETEVDFSDHIADSEIVQCASSFDSPKTKVDRTPENDKCKQSGSVSKRLFDDIKTAESLKKKSVGVKKGSEHFSRNPVNDNFGFQLLESYRCLGCGEVEGRTQEYFGLYVNLPEDERGHTIQDAITTYMSADERELKCEKCGHDTSSVVTSVKNLPRILIVQLKRYEYKPEQCQSIKVSSKVHVNRWISLDNFMTDDVAGPFQWNPDSGSVPSSQNPKEATLTVRNLSSELNMCDRKVEEDDELPSLSPAKPLVDGVITSNVPENEDEELQMVMRRSMDDVQGGQEEDEIQQAIRLSLQEMGMSYSQENQGENSNEEQSEEEEEEAIFSVEENKESGRHAYCLISIISHFGLTTNTGHYVSDVYNCDEDSWFHYDDESVAKISESVVFAEGRQKNGYIFFYMHKDLFQKIKNKAKR